MGIRTASTRRLVRTSYKNVVEITQKEDSIEQKRKKNK